MDVLVRVLVLEEQELGVHQVRNVVVDIGAEEDDPVFEQPGVDVVRALTSVGLLDHHWD